MTEAMALPQDPGEQLMTGFGFVQAHAWLFDRALRCAVLHNGGLADFDYNDTFLHIRLQILPENIKNPATACRIYDLALESLKSYPPGDMVRQNADNNFANRPHDEERYGNTPNFHGLVPVYVELVNSIGMSYSMVMISRPANWTSPTAIERTTSPRTYLDQITKMINSGVVFAGTGAVNLADRFTPGSGPVRCGRYKETNPGKPYEFVEFTESEKKKLGLWVDPEKRDWPEDTHEDDVQRLLRLVASGRARLPANF